MQNKIKLGNIVFTVEHLEIPVEDNSLEEVFEESEDHFEDSTGDFSEMTLQMDSLSSETDPNYNAEEGAD